MHRLSSESPESGVDPRELEQGDTVRRHGDGPAYVVDSVTYDRCGRPRVNVRLGLERRTFYPAELEKCQT